MRVIGRDVQTGVSRSMVVELHVRIHAVFEQEIDHAYAAVGARPRETALQLRLGGVRAEPAVWIEKPSYQIDAAKARGAREVGGRAKTHQVFRRLRAAIREAPVDEPATMASSADSHTLAGNGSAIIASSFARAQYSWSFVHIDDAADATMVLGALFVIAYHRTSTAG